MHVQPIEGKVTHSLGAWKRSQEQERVVDALGVETHCAGGTQGTSALGQRARWLRGRYQLGSYNALEFDLRGHEEVLPR